MGGGTGSGALLRGSGTGFGPRFERFDPEQRTLVHVLRAQAEERPDRPWLVFDGEQELTFGAAYERARAFAAALAATAGSAANVAILLRNHTEFMPALYGAMMAGGSAVPLNPELRGPLLERALSHSEAAMLVTDADGLERVARLDSRGSLAAILNVDDGPAPDGIDAQSLPGWLEAGPGPAAAPAGPPEPERNAALLFTSGTTGGSKAVVCSHHYMYAFSAAIADSLEHREEDVLTTPLQLCHVAALGAISNAALHTGCTAHLKRRFSASRFWEDIAADGATFCMVIGQMPEMILKSVPEAPPHRLDYVYVVPRPQSAARFEERYGTKVISQAYGLTEAFPHTPSKHVSPDDPVNKIGKPDGWFDYGVVDERDRLVPPGVEGELVYRSQIPFGMFSGYYRDADATTSAMRNCMFHTGDLGYYDEDGAVYFSRRRSDTIRRAGENLSSAEVEAIAVMFPRVLEVAVYGVADKYVGEEIKLDFVADEPVDVEEYHRWLVDSLPRYMVPRYMVQLDSFPKTASERIEKYKLKEAPLDKDGVHHFRLDLRSPSRTA